MAWSTAPKIGTVAEVASGGLTLSEPAGVASGDLMVASIAFRDSAAFTLPSGWTLVAQETSGDTVAVPNGVASALMAYIVRGASAPALTFTRTSGDVALGRIVGYTPQSGVPTFDTHSAFTDTVRVYPTVAPGLTTGEANALLVGFMASPAANALDSFTAATDPTTASGATDTTNAPSGAWRERADSDTATGADTTLAIVDALKATAGATGSFTAGYTLINDLKNTIIVASFYEVTAAAGDAAITEASDAVTSAGSVPALGAFAATEADDTAASAGVAPIAGALAQTEADDTAASAGVAPIAGAGDASDDGDTAASAGVAPIAGALAQTEADDTATGEITLGVIVVGGLEATEADDTAASAGVAPIAGALAQTEADDTAASAGVAPIAGALAQTEDGDTLFSANLPGDTLFEDDDVVASAGELDADYIARIVAASTVFTPPAAPSFVQTGGGSVRDEYFVVPTAQYVFIPHSPATTFVVPAPGG